MPKLLTLALIVGNRGFFPDHLAKEGREAMIGVLEKAGIRVIALTPEQSKFGAVETPEEARRCAELFRKHREEIDGIIVTLPNFGEERGIVDAIRHSTLQVPVLVQATPDRTDDMKISDRRDSFCGKMSACNNLKQYGIPYSITSLHTSAPNSESFAKDLAWFSAVCRIVRGFRNLRIGSHRRASRRIQYGPLFREAPRALRHLRRTPRSLGNLRPHRSPEGHGRRRPGQARRRSRSMSRPTTSPKPALLKMAKLGAVIEGWMKETYCTITAIQCWTSMEEYFGVVPCTVMSMMSENLFASACEVDVCGVVGMHALALASETPSALLDWNNNYGSDPDKASASTAPICRSTSSKT